MDPQRPPRRRASDHPKRRAADRADEALQSELLGLSTLGIGALICLALASAHPDDLEPAGRLATQGEAYNWIGPLGAEIADMLLRGFGVVAFLLPLSLALISLSLFRGRRILHRATDLIGYIALILSSGFAAHLVFEGQTPLGYPAGGELGRFGAEILRALLGRVGAYVFVYVLLLSSFLFTTRLSGEALKRGLKRALGRRRADLRQKLKPSALLDAEGLDEAPLSDSVLVDFEGNKAPSSWGGALMSAPKGDLEDPAYAQTIGALVVDEAPREKAPREETITETHAPDGSSISHGADALVDEAYLPSDESLAFTRDEIEADTALMPMLPDRGFTLSLTREAKEESLGDLSDLDLGLLGYTPPSLAHLRAAPPRPDPETLPPLRDIAARLTHALEGLGLEGKMVKARRGPVLSLFEFEPAPNTPIGKLVAAGPTLAHALGLPKIRVQPPSSGELRVRFEIPNPVLMEIVLGPLLEAEGGDWCPLPLGVGIDGQPYIIDLFVIRHLLLGGARGGGFFDAALLSLLYRYAPSDVQLILIDAERDPEVYDGLPHLLFPLIRDEARALRATRWLAGEARRREALFEAVGAENFIHYHEDEARAPLTLIVLMIDALSTLRAPAFAALTEALSGADLGIHVIARLRETEALALTALRALPTLGVMAFELADSASSRALLSVEGAEQLLPDRDALFLDPHDHGVRRIHTPNVTPTEIHSVLTSVKTQQDPHYLDLDEVAPPTPTQVDGAARLYRSALLVVRRTGRCTPEHLQAQLNIDYKRAERLTAQMEADGLIERTGPNHPPRLNKAALAAHAILRDPHAASQA
ncbi:DNA translocase FtsK 4TM domain-containing protein [Myxococcota bacterium]|nr:DNA translocase FtsK 4TM domain-containing protein [Myxococcota bacterium]MBU1430163.1 DNA translocase FtsK 4TM domain-containing protein [Myxococcota bacterium]MBU1900697.1 DNA translocase FtsK 4TM domain-containing protein [Myxococcota bacterium]